MPWTLVVDQDPGAAWSGYVNTAGGDVELGFDFGSVQPIRDMEWLPTWPMQGLVEVQLSADGSDWYRLRTIDLVQQPVDTWFTVPVGYVTRYMRLIFQLPQGGTGQVGSLAEIKIWLYPSGGGQSLATLQTVTPEPSTAAALPTTAVDPTSIPATQQVIITSTNDPAPETQVPVSGPGTQPPVVQPNTETGTVTGTGSDGLRCRTAPSLDAPVITVLADGTTVPIGGEQQGDWLPVNCGEVDGYVAAAYISVDESLGEPASTVTATPTETPVPATKSGGVPDEHGDDRSFAHQHGDRGRVPDEHGDDRGFAHHKRNIDDDRSASHRRSCLGSGGVCPADGDVRRHGGCDGVREQPDHQLWQRV